MYFYVYFSIPALYYYIGAFSMPEFPFHRRSPCHPSQRPSHLGRAVLDSTVFDPEALFEHEPQSRMQTRRELVEIRAVPGLSPKPCCAPASFRQKTRFSKSPPDISRHFRTLIWVKWERSHAFLNQYRHLARQSLNTPPPPRHFRTLRTSGQFIIIFAQEIAPHFLPRTGAQAGRLGWARANAFGRCLEFRLQAVLILPQKTA